MSSRVCRVKAGGVFGHDLGSANLSNVSDLGTAFGSELQMGHGDARPFTWNLYSKLVWMQNTSLGQKLSRYPNSSIVSS